MTDYEKTLEKFQKSKFTDVNSMVHKYGGDPRLMLTAFSTLLLQVAHPTVSAGVREHSNYLNEPFTRLLRTMDFVYVMTYGEPRDMILMGNSIKNIHKSIRGTKPNGSKYSALEPEAYAWVHATLAYFMVKGNQLLGTPMSEDEINQFWAEWREVGTLIHVKQNALPETWKGFEEYFERMITTKLEKTEEVDALLDLIKAKAGPAAPGVLFVIAGLLPDSAKTLLGLEWTFAHELAFQAFVKTVKISTPLAKYAIPYTGKVYLTLRRASIKNYYGL